MIIFPIMGLFVAFINKILMKKFY